MSFFLCADEGKLKGVISVLHIKESVNANSVTVRRFVVVVVFFLDFSFIEINLFLFQNMGVKSADYSKERNFLSKGKN